ncbi:MAG TPA: HxsD-like protein [Polyangia bacterium]|jgi:hypothetical protein
MASLRFNKKIYTAGAIRQATQAYADVVQVSQRTRGAYHEVDLAVLPEGAGNETLPQEFANYVLYATLLERRS